MQHLQGKKMLTYLTISGRVIPSGVSEIKELYLHSALDKTDYDRFDDAIVVEVIVQYYNNGKINQLCSQMLNPKTLF